MHLAFLHDLVARLEDEIWVLVKNSHLVGYLFFLLDTSTAVHASSTAHVAVQLIVASAMGVESRNAWVAATGGENRFFVSTVRQQPRMDPQTNDGGDENETVVPFL